MLKSSYDTEVVFMLFKDWLKQFAGDVNWDKGDDVNVFTVLNKKYEKLRHVKDGDEYPLTDYTKAGIKNNTTSVREFADKRFSRIRAPYKSVKLLTNADTLPDGTTNGWYYREYQPQGERNKALKARLSLNVYMASGLIEHLDDIVNEDKGKHIAQYKTPSDLYHWQSRHDPITIYFYDLTPQLLNKIVEAVRPFLRPEKSAEIVSVKNPYNIELPVGIYYNEEYSRQSIKQFLDSFYKYFPWFYRDVLNAFDHDRKHKLSAGQMYILHKFQKQLAQDIDKIDKKSIEYYLEERRQMFVLGFKEGIIKLQNSAATLEDVEGLVKKQALEDEYKLNAFIERFSQKSKK